MLPLTQHADRINTRPICSGNDHVFHTLDQPRLRLSRHAASARTTSPSHPPYVSSSPIGLCGLRPCVVRTGLGCRPHASIEACRPLVLPFTHIQSLSFRFSEHSLSVPELGHSQNNLATNVEGFQPSMRATCDYPMSLLVCLAFCNLRCPLD